MNTLTDTGVNRAITTLEPVKIAALIGHQERRLRKVLASYTDRNDYASAYRLLQRLDRVDGAELTPVPDCVHLKRQAD